jgi:hypothetical protein
MSTDQRTLLACLEATERLASPDGRWVTARAVARRLSPTADPEQVGRKLSQLHQLGLVELWFEGGSSYYRLAR